MFGSNELYLIFSSVIEKIIDQCGATHIRREIFDNNQKFDDQFSNSTLSSLLDQQIDVCKTIIRSISIILVDVTKRNMQGK